MKGKLKGTGGDWTVDDVLEHIEENKGKRPPYREKGNKRGYTNDRGWLNKGGAISIATTTMIATATAIALGMNAAENLFAGLRSEHGTLEYDSETYLLRRADGDLAMADLDAVCIALEASGAEAFAALVMFDTLDDAGSAFERVSQSSGE
jgi:hypothetical protein